MVAIGALFTLARFGETFLVLRSQQVGLSLYLAPLVLVAMSVVRSLSAYPFDKLSDHLRHTTLLAWGLGVLILADLVLAVSAHWAVTLASVTMWGLHMGTTQGLLTIMVADIAPEDLRDAASGFFNLANGLSLLVTSALAGPLWDQFGAASAFHAGAVFYVATIALIILAQYDARRLSSDETAGAGRIYR